MSPARTVHLARKIGASWPSSPQVGSAFLAPDRGLTCPCKLGLTCILPSPMVRELGFWGRFISETAKSLVVSKKLDTLLPNHFTLRRILRRLRDLRLAGNTQPGVTR